jgi:hypothetical protein
MRNNRKPSIVQTKKWFRKLLHRPVFSDYLDKLKVTSTLDSDSQFWSPAYAKFWNIVSKHVRFLTSATATTAAAASATTTASATTGATITTAAATSSTATTTCSAPT